MRTLVGAAEPPERPAWAAWGAGPWPIVTATRVSAVTVILVGAAAAATTAATSSTVVSWR